MNDMAEPAAPKSKGKKWGGMNAVEKLTFVGKLCVMIVTSGFICGNVLVE